MRKTLLFAEINYLLKFENTQIFIAFDRLAKTKAEVVVGMTFIDSARLHPSCRC